MASYSTSEFKAGLKLLLNGEPYTIVENEFVKPGKGQAFNRVRLKNLKTARVIDKTFKSSEKCEAADVFETRLQFLYADGETYYFMHPENFDQYECNKMRAEGIKEWVLDQTHYQVTFWNDEIFLVEPPAQMELKVVESEPNVKGDTATSGSKNAVVETGATVRVPMFVEVDDLIKVDTKTRQYISRVKNNT